MISCVGDDTFGMDTLKNYEKNGVSTSLVRVIAGTSTGVAPITVDGEGHNSIVIVPGANDSMSPETDAEGSEQFVKLVSSAKILVTQLEVPLKATVSAQKAARAAGCLTLLNPAPAELPTDSLEGCDLIREMYNTTDILVPNETELAALSGLPVSSISDAERAAKRILTGGAISALGSKPVHVLVTLGASGCLIASLKQGTGEFVSKHVPVSDKSIVPLDTTGAGDCFIGALSYFLSQRKEIEAGKSHEIALDTLKFIDILADCAQKANVVASNSVTKQGTQTSYPYPHELPPELFI